MQALPSQKVDAHAGQLVTREYPSACRDPSAFDIYILAQRGGESGFHGKIDRGFSLDTNFTRQSGQPLLLQGKAFFLGERGGGGANFFPASRSEIKYSGSYLRWCAP